MINFIDQHLMKRHYWQGPVASSANYRYVPTSTLVSIRMATHSSKMMASTYQTRIWYYNTQNWSMDFQRAETLAVKNGGQNESGGTSWSQNKETTTIKLQGTRHHHIT
jgi:hypothetical protein